MQKTKLSLLLQNFKAWEIFHLKDFVASPFFNKRKDLNKILDFYLKNMNLTKPELFNKVFTKEDYDEKKMNNLVSDLFKLTEQFLAYREISQNDSLITLNIVKAYRKKNQPTLFKKAITKGKRLLEKQPLRDRDYLLRRYDFEFEYFDYDKQRSRFAENNLKEITDIYDIIYISEKLKQYCFQSTYQGILSTNYTYNLKISILELIEKHPDLLIVPYLNIYFLAFKMEDTKKEEYFKEFCKMLKIHGDKISLSEKSTLYQLALNWTAKKINAGFEDYQRDAFELYKSGLKEKLFLENNEISKFTFANIITIGNNLMELNWVEEFIKSFAIYLPKHIRKNEMQFHLGFLRYKQKRFNEAKRLVLNFSSKDYLMNLRVKDLLIRIYFELEEFDALDSLLENIRVYIMRKNKLAKVYKELYRNKIKYYKKLLNLKPGKQAKVEFKREITELENPSLRRWLLEQMDKA